MERARILELAFVLALFGAYLALWRLKRRSQLRQTGTDPEVLARAEGPIQAYFARLVRLLKVLVVVLIGLHAVAPPTWPPLTRLALLDPLAFDVAGLALGLVGLLLCRVAQVTMGASWRVGIDAAVRTPLVTTGIYRWIRNPTYLGLYFVHLGLWLIWPTCSVAAYVTLFFVVMELQVRCEEEHLFELHGEAGRQYLARTWRYVPWVY